MQIKYVGPRPVVSETGIIFDNRFDDRYTYLNIAVQLLTALDRDDFEERTYVYRVDSKRLGDDDIVEGLKKYCGTLEDVVRDGVESEEKKIDDELQQAEESDTLSPDEKEALIKNLTMMRNYRIQYTTNEMLYNCAVKIIANLVKNERLDYIIVPMFQRFAAILHSVQDELAAQQFPIDTRMDIYEESGKLMAKMEVKNR